MTEPVHVAPRPAITDEQRAAVLERVNRPRSRRWTAWIEWAKSFQIAILLSLFVRAFVVEAFKIPSGSMEHTLLVGDFLLVNKLVYGAEVPFTGKHLPAIRQPRHGDVIVFQYPVDPSKSFVKRLIGLPGDTVAMRHSALFVNGVPQVEPYVVHIEPDADPPDDLFAWQRAFVTLEGRARDDYHPSRNNWGPLVVPPKNFFVLGDNRDNSLDSRYWGFVADSLLRGQPLFVYYSYVPDSAQRFVWLTHIRWNRLGERID